MDKDSTENGKAPEEFRVKSSIFSDFVDISIWEKIYLFGLDGGEWSEGGESEAKDGKMWETTDDWRDNSLLGDVRKVRARGENAFLNFRFNQCEKLNLD